MITLECSQLYTTLWFSLACLFFSLPHFCHCTSVHSKPECINTVHQLHSQNKHENEEGGETQCDCLQNYSDGPLPGVCAGAEAMGRPQDTVTALGMVNFCVSYVTALLLNSLLLCWRKRKASSSTILSKQTSPRWWGRTSISSDKAAIPLPLKPYQTRSCTTAEGRSAIL